MGLSRWPLYRDLTCWAGGVAGTVAFALDLAPDEVLIPSLGLLGLSLLDHTAVKRVPAVEGEKPGKRLRIRAKADDVPTDPLDALNADDHAWLDSVLARGGLEREPEPAKPPKPPTSAGPGARSVTVSPEPPTSPDPGDWWSEPWADEHEREAWADAGSFARTPPARTCMAHTWENVWSAEGGEWRRCTRCGVNLDWASEPDRRDAREDLREALSDAEDCALTGDAEGAKAALARAKAARDAIEMGLALERTKEDLLRATGVPPAIIGEQPGVITASKITSGSITAGKITPLPVPEGHDARLRKAVRDWQRMHRVLGFPSVVPDGLWGPRSQAAMDDCGCDVCQRFAPHVATLTRR